MYKKFTIWNEDYGLLEDWKDDIDTEEEERGVKLSEEEQYAFVAELNSSYLDTERENLDIQLENPILILADLGLWNGRPKTCKMINSGNISDILYSQVRSESYCHWYSDGYNICCDESHHDGVNHYIYREITRMEGIENLLDRIYVQRPFSNSMLNYYTRSIVRDVADVYGLLKKEA